MDLLRNQWWAKTEMQGFILIALQWSDLGVGGSIKICTLVRDWDWHNSHVSR